MTPLSDTTFEVYKDAELIGTYTTDANGEIWLYDLQPGTYLVKEIAVKPGYVINSTPQEIEIEAGNESYTLVFLNLVKPGIHLVKIDAETKQPCPTPGSGSASWAAPTARSSRLMPPAKST